MIVRIMFYEGIWFCINRVTGETIQTAASLEALTSKCGAALWNY